MLPSSKRIAELEAQVKDLEAKQKDATEGRAAIDAELTKAKADLATAQAKALTLEGDLKAANDGRTAAETSLKAMTDRAEAADKKAADAEKSINDQVNARLAAAGVDPVQRDSKAGKVDGTKEVASTSGTPRQRAAAAAANFKVFAR